MWAITAWHRVLITPTPAIYFQIGALPLMCASDCSGLCNLHMNGSRHHGRISGEPLLPETRGSSRLLADEARPFEKGARSEITVQPDFVSGPNVLHKYRLAKRAWLRPQTNICFHFSVGSQHTGVIEQFLLELFSIHGLEENKVLTSDLSLE